ncbi:hypothetical protein Tco_1017029 [Tanacetum coccineum]|uniref:Uncharacterized protein n=1 Tax=Tanacetum coccineum TaxID=301880 RepID=A0ABQ5FQV2_9ASTR
MVGELTALKTWRLFNINFFFHLSISESTFHIHLIDYEVHVLLQIESLQTNIHELKRHSVLYHLSSGVGEAMDGMDKEGLVRIGFVFETEASSAGEDSGSEV